MATYLLVHGAWHGGWCWVRVAKLLRDAGHDVYTPTLTGLGDRAHLATPETDLECHINDLLAVIEAGFGDFSDFNKGVRSMFELRREPSAASLQQVDGTSEAGGRSVELENVPVEVPRP